MHGAVAPSLMCLCTRVGTEASQGRWEKVSARSLFRSPADTTWGVPPGGSPCTALPVLGGGSAGAGRRPGRPGDPRGSGASSARCPVVPVSHSESWELVKLELVRELMVCFLEWEMPML